MKWASAVSGESELTKAVKETAESVRTQLGADRADLVAVFVSPHHGAGFEHVPELVASELEATVMIGCSAGGVIGGAREIEQQPGFSLTAACLPTVELHPLHLEPGDAPGRQARVDTWEELVGVPAAKRPHFLLLPDPLTFEVENLLTGLDRAYPQSKKIGGLASGGRQPGANALFLDSAVYRSGFVGVALSGDIEVDTIVAQGCRPIGEPMFLTRCDRNIVWEFDGHQPLAVLRDLHERLDERDRELARHSLFLGIAMKEDRHEYQQGDFLIRNLVGFDSASGALAVGAMPKKRECPAFH